jgi:hypothetical protein
MVPGSMLMPRHPWSEMPSLGGTAQAPTGQGGTGQDMMQMMRMMQLMQQMMNQGGQMPTERKGNCSVFSSFR